MDAQSTRSSSLTKSKKRTFLLSHSNYLGFNFRGIVREKQVQDDSFEAESVLAKIKEVKEGNEEGEEKERGLEQDGFA